MVLDWKPSTGQCHSNIIDEFLNHSADTLLATIDHRLPFNAFLDGHFLHGDGMSWYYIRPNCTCDSTIANFLLKGAEPNTELKSGRQLFDLTLQPQGGFNAAAAILCARADLDKPLITVTCRYTEF